MGEDAGVTFGKSTYTRVAIEVSEWDNRSLLPTLGCCAKLTANNTNTLSRQIDRMELEFPVKFDALALQFKSEILQKIHCPKLICTHNHALFDTI